MNLYKHPILKAIYNACLANENFPPSAKQTDQAILLGEIGNSVENLVDSNAALEAENRALRDELYSLESAMDVRCKALSRLYCAEHATIGNDFSAVLQMELEDAMKQADKAIRMPLSDAARSPGAKEGGEAVE